jgi:predicted RNase H-like nuclease (RuvC/YqgF family)
MLAVQLLNQGSLVDLAVVVPVVASVIAYYKREKRRDQRAATADWKDVADQRLASIADRDRLLQEQNHKMEAMRVELEGMRQTITRLETEIAELKRHDTSAVMRMIEQLATAMEQARTIATQREQENAVLFADLRAHIFPMIQELHAALPKPA